MKQRVLVLGAGQFVGARVLAALSASTWATAVPWSAPIGELTGAALSGIDAVFNGTLGSPTAILAAAGALSAALTNSTGRIRAVHLSSMTVYGSFTGDAVETTALRADLGAYGASQIEGERLLGAHPQSVILRPGCEYGPQCPDWSARIARLLRAHRLGDLGSAGDGVCNLLYVDDLVSAVMAALREPGIEGARFNLAMRAPPTWNEYFLRFAKALGAVPVSRIGARRLKIETRLLAPPLKVLGVLERRLGSTPNTPPPLTPSLLGLCGQAITLNVERAEQLLGLSWTPLQHGLQRTAAAL